MTCPRKPLFPAASLQRVMRPRLSTCSKIILFVDIFNDSTKQINQILLNNSDLLNFLSCSPMLLFFYECKTLCAFGRLKQYIVSSCKLSFPGNGFGKSGFVKNIVVCESGRKNQVIRC